MAVSLWHARHSRVCDFREKGSWQLPQSFSSLACPLTTGPGMTSLSNKFCERAVNDIALATTIPIARTRLSRWLNGAGLRSEEMRREDVNDGRNHEKKEQGQVEDVPKPEEAFIECKSSGLLYRGDM